MRRVFLLFFFYVFLTLFQDVLAKSKRHRSNDSKDGKIVGGYNTTIERVPYQAYLLLKKGSEYYQCGGSVLSTRYILTAAHCIYGITTAYIRVGSTDANSGGKIYTSSNLMTHPQYNARTSDYDIGLIRLETSMTLDGKNTKAVKLPRVGSSVPVGTNVFVTGWGATSENGDTSGTLQAVRVPIVSATACRQSYGSSITTRMFCAGVSQGGKDSCQGDSGGPAVNEKNGLQVGVVSFGAGCARAKYPGVYTSILSAGVRSWIQTTTGL